jgi:hypothetical protein
MDQLQRVEFPAQLSGRVFMSTYEAWQALALTAEPATA